MTDSHMEMWNSSKYDQHKSATSCKAHESSQAEMKNKNENTNMNVGLFVFFGSSGKTATQP